MAESNRKIVVVAGGTGGIGRHVVNGIAATKKYVVKVFSRKGSSSSTNLTIEGVEIVNVDYSDHASLVKELQGVHTVIVCLISLDKSSIDSQVNLLNACLEAKVKRFAPSEWAGTSGADTIIELYRALKVPVYEKVKASGIEYTLFTNGMFMDYFASPQRPSASLPPLTFGVDFNQGQANFVGTGDEPFCLTLADDVGRFVAAALELDKWEERLGMIGSRTTWNELIKLGEKVRGKKFVVNRTTADEALSQRDSKPENIMKNFMQEVFVALVQGEFDYEPTLNRQCPQISPTTIEQFISKWWGGKEGQTL